MMAMEQGCCGCAGLLREEIDTVMLMIDVVEIRSTVAGAMAVVVAVPRSRSKVSDWWPQDAVTQVELESDDGAKKGRLNVIKYCAEVRFGLWARQE